MQLWVGLYERESLPDFNDVSNISPSKHLFQCQTHVFTSKYGLERLSMNLFSCGAEYSKMPIKVMELSQSHSDSTFGKLPLYLALWTKKCLTKQKYLNGLFSDLCQAKLHFHFQKEEN